MYSFFRKLSKKEQKVQERAYEGLKKKADYDKTGDYLCDVYERLYQKDVSWGQDFLDFLFFFGFNFPFWRSFFLKSFHFLGLVRTIFFNNFRIFH